MSKGGDCIPHNCWLTIHTDTAREHSSTHIRTTVWLTGLHRGGIKARNPTANWDVRLNSSPCLLPKSWTQQGGQVTAGSASWDGYFIAEKLRDILKQRFGRPKLKVLRRLVRANETLSQSLTPSILHFQSNHRAVSVNAHRVSAGPCRRNKEGRESHLLWDQQCLLSGRYGLKQAWNWEIYLLCCFRLF